LSHWDIVASYLDLPIFSEASIPLCFGLFLKFFEKIGDVAIQFAPAPGAGGVWAVARSVLEVGSLYRVYLVVDLAGEDGTRHFVNNRK
jgi:hypothetical protein